MPLAVTNVQIHFTRPRQGLFAMARVVLNDALVLEGIGVHRKLDGGLRLTYPTRALPNGQDKTLFHPVVPALSKAIEKAIFEKIVERQKDVAGHDRHRPSDD